LKRQFSVAAVPIAHLSRRLTIRTTSQIHKAAIAIPKTDMTFLIPRSYSAETASANANNPIGTHPGDRFDELRDSEVIELAGVMPSGYRRCVGK